MAWVCNELRKAKVKSYVNVVAWFEMQCIKEGSTLRVSNKGDKPEPRIVFRYGSQRGRVSEFLRFRKLVKSIVRKLDSDFSSAC